MIALELPESGYQGGEDKPKEELARDASEILTSKIPMLYDYFSIEIDTDANILSIPLLLGLYCVKTVSHREPIVYRPTFLVTTNPLASTLSSYSILDS